MRLTVESASGHRVTFHTSRRSCVPFSDELGELIDIFEFIQPLADEHLADGSDLGMLAIFSRPDVLEKQVAVFEKNNCPSGGTGTRVERIAGAGADDGRRGDGMPLIGGSGSGSSGQAKAGPLGYCRAWARRVGARTRPPG